MGTQLRILSQKEINQIYGLPKLTAKQRKDFLELTLPEQELVRTYRTPLTRVFFILQLAYFKFKQQFFTFDLSEVSADVVYLQAHYFSNQSLPLEGVLTKPRRLQQQKVILDLFGYKMADATVRTALFERACQSVKLSANPTFMFRDLMNWLEQKKVVLPAYSFLQRHIIGKAVTSERKRLEDLIQAILGNDYQLYLDKLINEKTGNWYTLTWLSRETPNFKPQSLRQETKRKAFIEPLYSTAKLLVEKLDISNENIHYYASLAEHYTVGELRQFKNGMAYVFLLCYLHYRYRSINDILVEAFKYYVRKYESQAKSIVKEYFYKYHLDANAQLSKVPQILALFINNEVDGNTPFFVVRKMVLDMLDKEKILLLTDFINKNRVDEIAVRWEHYEEIKQQVSYNLRHLFLHLDFETEMVDSSVMEAVTAVKAVLQKGKALKSVPSEELPKAFIPKYLQSYLWQNDEFVAARYELMLYQALNRELWAGHVFIKNSFRNQSLEADLIPLEYWQKNKDQILAQIDLPKLLQTPEQRLGELKAELESKIKLVNKSISKGDNKDVSIKNNADGTLKWQLTYNAKAPLVNHKIYKQLPVIGIIPLLHWVNEQTHFMDSFQHILHKGNTKKADPAILRACLLALGTNHGIGNMAARSDIPYNHLNRTAQNFIRTETLQQANQIIVDATAKLSMFTHYNITPNTLHSSSDGQKFASRFDTVNARYSPKYFGLEKGISIHTMILNHIPVNAKIIGSNEHESHYVFDLVYNNTTAIQPAIHSTDSHGTNKVNFAILDCFGYQFAPRYRRFQKEMIKLVGFHVPKHYPDKYLIKPCRQINDQRFIDNWDTFQRIIASLAQKTTSQSTIVRKLSSFHRVNQIQAVLTDYNDIIKSIFMLDYIHSTTFRQNIQTALNRGEGYHRLRKNVAYAHDGKFQVHSQQEQLVWSEATRLICNAIILYNTFLISQLLEQHTKTGNEKEIKILQNVSPIAWQHINLHGLYQFKKEVEPIDWKAILEQVKIK